jgi:hypothetical protein
VSFAAEIRSLIPEGKPFDVAMVSRAVRQRHPEMPATYVTARVAETLKRMRKARPPQLEILVNGYTHRPGLYLRKGNS